MSEKSTQSSGGIGFCGLLCIVFITLKLTGFIAWSWWWVLSPIWIPWAVIAAIFLTILFFGLVAALIAACAGGL